MVGGRKQSKKHIDNSVNHTLRAVIETMEPRFLLSAALAYPQVQAMPNVTAATIPGYTPSQIRKSYGFNDVSFSGGTVAASGAGQTIAIVDAYNDPNIIPDLAVFDKQFGLNAPPSFNVVGQTGSATVLPATDSDWAGEISLDVEWSHAIAPQANILLVEAQTNSFDDLFAAVNYARNQPQVSVVSMSFGGSEDVQETNLGETGGQAAQDAILTTPTNHQGITFIASAGDSGSEAGVQFPSASPNVISVGGTSLNADDSGNGTFTTDGTYVSEAGWDGTNGGVSVIETEPTYQTNAQSTGKRSDPDVSYNGDPNTGVAVYDSVPDSFGDVGWEQVGGTSAGAPQWSALVAIADQGRAIDGLGTLDGPSQTLPDLYSLYAPPSDPTGYANYLNYFHDVVTGGGGNYRFRWGGTTGNGIEAGTGYDEVTGLGSPHAANIIDVLAADTATVVPDGSQGTVSTGGTTVTPPQSAVTPSPVSVDFITDPTSVAFTGDLAKVRIQLTNTQSTIFNGPTSIMLYATTDGTLATAMAVDNVAVGHVILQPASRKIVALRFKYSDAMVNQTYSLVAAVQATGTADAAGISVGSTHVTVAPTVVKLSTTFIETAPLTIKTGERTSVFVRIQNLGTVTAAGLLNLTLYDSSTGCG